MRLRTFAGTGRLVRLALRRDRIKLPAWILAITAATLANVPAVMDIYGSSLKEQITYATTTASSLVSRLFGGPISSPDIGEIVINETFLFGVIAIAFMSTLAIVRHTRQNEETGRAEIIGSAVVGRHAQLTAALLVTIGANIVVGILLTLVYKANNLPLDGSIATAGAAVAIGIVFAGVAAVTSQISESARGANSLAAAVLGIAFLLRGAGDAMGKLHADGLGLTSAWPSWLSPIGWAQQIYPFTQARFWIFWLLALLFVGLVAAAFYLNAIRDLGLGMLPARRGPAHAARSLLSPLGLAWRLQKGVLRGWVIGILVMGATIGLVSKEFSQLLQDNPDIAEFMSSLGGQGSFNDVFFAGMFSYMGVAIAAYAVQALQRMRTEEAGGLLEPVLSTKVSKAGWMLSHITCAFGGVVVLFAIMGASSAVSYVLATGESWSEVLRLTGAAMAQIPAALVIAGLAVAIFGLLPRLAIVMSWTVFGLCLIIVQFGALLKLPQSVLNASPFTHIPAVPAESLTIGPLLILLAVSIGLTAAGLIFFRRRDITTA